jgi:hypothetical protein
LVSQLDRVRQSAGLEQLEPMLQSNARGSVYNEFKFHEAVVSAVSWLKEIGYSISELTLALNKNKYVNQAQATESDLLEKLRQDNALLQRQMFKYESTIKDLDSLFRRDDSKDDIIFQLKQLTDD